MSVSNYGRRTEVNTKTPSYSHMYKSACASKHTHTLVRAHTHIYNTGTAYVRFIVKKTAR